MAEDPFGFNAFEMAPIVCQTQPQPVSGPKPIIEPSPKPDTQGATLRRTAADPIPAPASSDLGLGFTTAAPASVSQTSNLKGFHLRSSESKGKRIGQVARAPSGRVLPSSFLPAVEVEKVKGQQGRQKKEKEKVKPTNRERGKKKLADGLRSCDKGKKQSPFDLMKVVELFSKKVDEAEEKIIVDMDILDILHMKGFFIEPPRWHRPDGYGEKPKPK